MKKKIIIIAASLCVLAGVSVFAVNAIIGKSAKSDSINYDVKKVKPYVNKVNEFSCDLFSNVIEEEENTFVSPLSLYTALAMSTNGATGSTRDELMELLGVKDIGAMNEGIGGYFQNSQDEDVTIVNSNSVWLDNKLEKSDVIDKNFIDPLEKSYNADVFKDTNFGSEDTVDKINAWVSDKTNGKIETLANKFSSETMVLLVNAIYFNAKWTNPFDEGCTMDEYFNGASDRNQINIMHNAGYYKYFEDNNFKGVEIDYGNGSYAMDVLLSSDDSKRTGEVWRSMTTDEQLAVLDTFDTGAEEQSVIDLAIPRLNLAYSADNMVDVIKKMGISKAFDESAEFGNIGKQLKINEIIHKTILNVDEESTEAAAVSAVGKDASSPLINGVEFVADRPFILFIRDINSGMVMFAGEINNLE